MFIGSPYLKSVPSFISGGVFRCAINLNLGVKLSCNEIDFHNGMLVLSLSVCFFGINSLNLLLVNFHGNGFPFEPRNKSLLGFSLLRTSSAVIACAPNWVSGDLTPEGMCFSLNPTSSLPMVAFKNPTKIPVRANRPYESHTLFGFSLDYNPVRSKPENTSLMSFVVQWWNCTRPTRVHRLYRIHFGGQSRFRCFQVSRRPCAIQLLLGILGSLVHFWCNDGNRSWNAEIQQIQRKSRPDWYGKSCGSLHVV